jgi:LysM repeat protein
MKRLTVKSLTLFCASWVLLAGCVMTEKYEAEKARAMNFQRLLAQEEKRTGEMDSELKRLKRESADLEAKNRELTAQLQAVREQLARVQEEMALREAAMTKKATESAKAPKGRRADRGDKDLLGTLEEPPAEVAIPEPSGTVTVGGTPRYHEVKPGETLFSIAKRYGTDVKTLKSWNSLRSNSIEVGQRLVVGRE